MLVADNNSRLVAEDLASEMGCGLPKENNSRAHGHRGVAGTYEQYGSLSGKNLKHGWWAGAGYNEWV
jgi:hypothetical protein